MTDRDYVPAATALRVYAGIQVVLASAGITLAVVVSGPDISRTVTTTAVFAVFFGALSGLYLRTVLRRAPRIQGERLVGPEVVIRGELRWIPIYALPLLLVPAFPEICAVPLGIGAVYLAASAVVARWQRRHDCVLLRDPWQRLVSRGVFDSGDYAVHTTATATPSGPLQLPV